MAKPKVDVGNTAKYVKLLSFPKRRAFTLTVCMILTVLFSAWIWVNLQQKNGGHWFILSIPMIFFGLFTNFLPPDEEWSYGPWQDASQKYERNIYD
jgi:hypothetical protein